MKQHKNEDLVKKYNSRPTFFDKLRLFTSVWPQYFDYEVLRISVSKKGLLEAFRDIFSWLGKALLVMVLSALCAIIFWYVRSKIANSTTVSYKAYVIWLDSLIFGQVPSLWMQRNLRSDVMDSFLRWIWFTYLYSIVFGATLISILRAEVNRYLLTVMLVLSTGLLIHYLIPTQPPWMSVEGVTRINGELYVRMDKNLMAAMPSIHQAIVCVVGCALWKYGLFGKLIGIFYNLTMALALVYLGEHFFVDSIAGMVISISSWHLAKHILNLFNKHSRNTFTSSYRHRMK